jgi:hypothetical protein
VTKTFSPADVIEITGRHSDTIYRHLRAGVLKAGKPEGTRRYMIGWADLVEYVGGEQRARDLVDAWEKRKG